MEPDFGEWSDDAEAHTEGTIRVLHVDDSEDFGELTELFLERESDRFEVVSKRSGAAGLEALESQAVDCVVSDFQMPGRSGLDFFGDIPPAHRDVPFILFTGKGSEEVASDAFSAGVTDYLQKERGTDQFAVLANRIERAVGAARARQRLEQTRRRFKTLVEEANDAILVISPDGTIRYATPATEHVLGRSPADLVGSNGFDPLHEDDVPAVAAELERLLENPEYRAQVDFRYWHGEEYWLWCEVRGRNLLANDDIAGVVVYVRDVDDRKNNERELERRERTFRAVFEEATEPMVIADDAGEIVDANPAACDLVGLPEDEFLGRFLAEFVADEPGVDFESAWDAFLAAEEERGTFELVRADGERRLVAFAASANILPDRHLSILRPVDQID